MTLNAIGLAGSIGFLATSLIALRTCRFPMKPLGHMVSEMSSMQSRSGDLVAVDRRGAAWLEERDMGIDAKIVPHTHTHTHSHTFDTERPGEHSTFRPSSTRASPCAHTHLATMVL